jgi:tetratricopeptide (TPR) repeat protein
MSDTPRDDSVPPDESDPCGSLTWQFDSAWQRWVGEVPDLSAWLPADADLRRAVLPELIEIDLEMRFRSARPARVEDYLARFPELADNPQALVDLIAAEYEFARRLPTPPPSLEDLLRRFPTLGEALQRRLQGGPAAAPAGDAQQTAVEPGPVALPSPADGVTPSPAWPRIPGFEIAAELGRGGMGVVYKAWEHRPGRFVALKVLHGGAQAGAVELRRFEIEVRAAARLQHPGIVQVYEVGTHQGEPYCALEYVDGPTLAQQLQGKPLPSRGAAHWVRDLASAVQYAHDQGVVHRDLKPSNVLLAAAGPKVTDFGLAKLRAGEGGLTQTGAVLGTPAYMAPEQAEGRTQEVGPAADVWALGVILYESLTGRPPFRGETTLDTLSQVRSAEPVPPGRLQPKLPRDLETICLKCLEKQPRRRYASARDLAEDLRRYLAGEPIRARPVGVGQRVWKWMRRRPLAATALAGSVLAVLVGAAGVAWHLDQMKAALGLARQEKERAEQFAAEADRQAKLAGTQQARAEANFRKVLTLAERLVHRPGSLPPASGSPEDRERRRLLEEMERFFLTFLHDNPADPAVRQETAWACQRAAQMYQSLGRRDRALELLRRAVDLQEALVKEYPGEVDYAQDLGQSHHDLGALHAEAGRFADAEAELGKALQLRQRLAAEEPDNADYVGELAQTRQALAEVYDQQGDLARAVAGYREAEAGFAALAQDHPDKTEYATAQALCRRALGELEWRQGRPDQAEKEYTAALEVLRRLNRGASGSEESIEALAQTLNSLGEVHRGAGRLDRAEAIHREALTLFERLARQYPESATHRHDLAHTRNQLGMIHTATGRLAEAEADHRAAQVLYDELIHEDPRDPWNRSGLAYTHTHLGHLRVSEGRLAEAEAAYTRARPLFEELAREQPGVVAHQLALASAYADMGNLCSRARKAAEALTWYARSVPVLESLAPPGKRPAEARFYLRYAYWGRAEALGRLGRHADALADWERALALADDTGRPAVRAGRAATLARLGECDRAVAEVEAVLRERPPPASGLYQIACTYARAAAAAHQSGKEQQAAMHIARAIEMLESSDRVGLFQDPLAAADLKADPDLQALRPREDFRKLLARVEKKHADRSPR